MPKVNSAARVPGLAGFNALSAAEAEDGLLACCASRAFAHEVAARRPYRDLAGLAEAAEAAVRGLTWPDVQEALAAHPRIGEPPRDGGRAAPASVARTAEPPRYGGAAEAGGREASWSRREQSGVEAAGQAVLDGLAEGNRAYEERFGHVYLICATGMAAKEMLDRLRERLRNDETTERGVVRTELARITRLRVAKLLGEEA
ncbi:2-oxo-4-hydroxy-4-carboxy-5-ureidoimidazoline decarboxylase [Streptosporangium album]|uniref:2-oxo-4-hydroxy-4-carboxy-5-ureidoimidazoline decarboxylase n=1 Tax=Streptosporangium album TaxID=47479 RepID=A0A7W7WBT6_9ACTN|nr:2-oxo-4-hydroxy-4-carboxy-5-ureidoimidazoline decarboxylase [Streptosporangium album]MBB4941356.1 2-oxo-4-hydroxy-4-carboxy-5-ureidoimidazoline decarboxylase [Streptosporangium album]